MPLQPITTKRIYLQIAEQIAQAIRDGEYPVGRALPSERALAEQLQVSRASVREALIALQLMGLVEVRPGGGAFVMTATSKGLSSDQLASEVSAFDLIHARQVIESEIACLAAGMATDEDLRCLEDLLILMERENTEGSPEEDGDRRFHLYLATMTRNGVLEMIARLLWELRQAHLWDILQQAAFTRHHRDAYLDDHRQIYECIARRDGPSARRAMVRHLKRLEHYFLKS